MQLVRSLRGKNKASQLKRDGITCSLGKNLTWFLLYAQSSVLGAAAAGQVTGNNWASALKESEVRWGEDRSISNPRTKARLTSAGRDA